MIRASVLKAYRLQGAASSWNQQRIQAAASKNMMQPVHSMHGAPIPPRSLLTAEHHSDDSQVRWRFPVDDRTENKLMQVHHGVVSQTCIITLNAVMPITHGLMEEALNILSKKVESLRTFFRLRDNQLWVADMPLPLLDFKSLSGSDLEKEHSNLTSSLFDLHNGPLWKARLIASPENTPCQFPEVKAKFPCQYDLLLSLHHAANDGIVVMLLTELLLTIIDHLLQNLPVDCQQVGELRDCIEAREEESRIKASLESDPARLEAELREHEMGKHVPLLIEAFGCPSEAVKPSTYVFPIVLLDKDVINRVIHKCRSLGVTMNSFMTAVGNTALVEMVRDAGLKRSSYSITSVHPVNCRRLMEKSSIPFLGYHGLQMTLTMATPQNVKDQFWEYAKKLDTKFRKKIKRNWMCRERVLDGMLRPEGLTYEAHYSRPLPLCYDYMFSNLYHPGSSTQGTGKLVQITSIQNKTVIHKAPFPLALALFGFRGQPRLEVGHSTVALSKEVTCRYLDKNLAVLHDISQALT